MSTIAFIGLGAMGGPMALNLMAAGHVLRVWNRSAAKTAAARDAGATVCASVADAVQGAQFVVSMVADVFDEAELLIPHECVAPIRMFEQGGVRTTRVALRRPPRRFRLLAGEGPCEFVHKGPAS